MTYLQQHTLGSLIKAVMTINFRNLPTLFFITGVLLIPLQILHFVVVPSELEINEGVRSPGGLTFTFLEFLAGALATFPATVAISEICLGIKPSVARSYRRAFSNPGRLIGTYLLVALVLAIAFLLLVIPGLVASVWYLFVAPVLVLEGLGGWAALQRSRELGKGHYWRNFGVYITFILMFYVSLGIIGAVLGLFSILLNSFAIVMIASAILSDVAAAFLVSVPVLLYYDMRARKEGYGAAQLTEDLSL